jgi:uncharacterized RDD family membrane protein YckC
MTLISTDATQTLIYGGFWRRFGALWLDFLFMTPLIALNIWGSEQSRLFDLYYFIPGVLFGFFYSVYLVHRYGGTPGKRVMKLRITRIDGSPVGYREAFLRYLPDALFGALGSVALIIAVIHLTDTQYFSATYLNRQFIIQSVAPSWYKGVMILGQVWVWSEFVVLLTNKKRRAIHDFIAGTVVIRESTE